MGLDNIKILTPQEFMKDAKPSEVIADIKRELESEDSFIDVYNIRIIENWSYLSGLIVGAENYSIQPKPI